MKLKSYILLFLSTAVISGGILVAGQMMKPTVAEAQALLDEDETDGYALFKMGMALGLEKRAEEADQAFLV